MERQLPLPLSVEGSTLHLICRRHDGSIIEVIPIDDPGDWNEAFKWAAVAFSIDRENRKGVTTQCA